ncbi:MAG TPA: hypothetical protein VH835_02020 [Dongiaceae bacterium]
MLRRCAAILLLLSLSGCNAFDFGLQENPDTTKYERKKTSEEQAAADLRACRAQAKAVLDRDENIDQAIESTHDTGSGINASPDLQANMDNYSYEQRYREIVNDCMRGRGYNLPQE